MEQIKLTEQKINLLTKSVWTLSDVKDYFQIGASKADALKNKVIGRSPNLEINKGKKHLVVSVEEMMKYHGTTRSKELDILKQAYQLQKELI